MSLTISAADGLTIVVYLAAVFSFGIYMSRREKTPGDFFLAGRRLPWYAIALSLFASNISSISLIGLSADGYRFGLAAGVLEWGAIFGLLLLTFVFLPYYQRSRVFTMPQFLELRYNVAARLLLAGAVIVFEMVITLPVLLYTGALFLEVLAGVPLGFSVVAIGIFVGVYTTFGGLIAVVWTDVVQGLVMIVGAATVTLLGLYRIGGPGVLMAKAESHMHVCLPADHPVYPFPATMIGGFFLVTVYYWCQNQTIVQRVLAGRTEWDARMGTIAACFIKLLLPFLIVVPGIIALVLFEEIEAPDRALPMLVDAVVPAGLRGLIVAAFIASLMSTADSTLTLMGHNFYVRLLPTADPAEGGRAAPGLGRPAGVGCLGGGGGDSSPHAKRLRLDP